MDKQLVTGNEILQIEWDESCGILDSVLKHPFLVGTAQNIGGEVFFYQFELDIPYNGEQKEVFEAGDVVYWRSQEEEGKFGILFMYGNTAYGDGTKPRTSSPGIKIGRIEQFDLLSTIETGTTLTLK